MTKLSQYLFGQPLRLLVCALKICLERVANKHAKYIFDEDHVQMNGSIINCTGNIIVMKRQYVWLLETNLVI